MSIPLVRRYLSRSILFQRRSNATVQGVASNAPVYEVHESQENGLNNDILLLVNENDKFIGTATKRYCHKVQRYGFVPLHRAFSVFLFNHSGDMLIQRRSSVKVVYPDYYSNACCSHPLFVNNKQEGIISAAKRRLHAEWGIPMDQMHSSMFTYMTRVHYHDPGDGIWGEHEIDYILFFQNDVTLKPDPNEISEHYFVPKKEFDAFLNDLKGPITPWFNMIRQNKLELWWSNLHRLHHFSECDKIHKIII